MSKEYFVLKGGRVIYKYGHYDKEGAEAVAKSASRLHPKAVIYIVEIVETYQGVPMPCAI